MTTTTLDNINKFNNNNSNKNSTSSNVGPWPEVVCLPRWTVEPDWSDVIAAAPLAGPAITQTGDRAHQSFWISSYDYSIDNKQSIGVHDRIEVSRVAGASAAGHVELRSLDSDGVIDIKVSGDSSERDLEVHRDGSSCRLLRPQWLHRMKSAASCMDLSPQGSLLAVSQGSSISIRECSTSAMQERRLLEGHLMDVTCTRFFPSGMVVLSGALDMQLRIWDLTNGECAAVLKGHRGRINALDIIGRGRNVMSGSSDGSLAMWECASQSVIRKYSVGAEVNDLQIISGSDCSWTSTNSSEDIASSGEHETEGKVAVYASGDGTFGAVDIRTAETVFKTTTPAPLTKIRCKDTTLLTGSSDGQVSIFDLRNISAPMFICQRNQAPITTLHCVSDTCFIAGSSDGSMFQYDTSNSNSLREYTTDQTSVYSAAVSNDGHIYLGTRQSIYKYQQQQQQ